MLTSIQTSGGKIVDLLKADPAAIDIFDVAWSLANQCRFVGHCDEFYSIAQHSLLVSYLCPPSLALDGLLHDGTEAYLGDVSSPLKNALPAYKVIERAWELAFKEKFGTWTTAEVKEADLRALSIERTAMMSLDPYWDAQGIPTEAWPPHLKWIRRLTVEGAFTAFLDRFTNLTAPNQEKS